MIKHSIIYSVFLQREYQGLQARRIEKKTARAILYTYNSQETESLK